MDTVKRLGEVDCYGSCTEWWFWVVEAAGYCGGQGNQSGGRGVEGLEAMLRRVLREDVSEVWQDKAFHYFAGRAEEGDRTMRLAIVWVLIRFRDRNDDGPFPYCWDGCCFDGVIENIAEERDACLANMFEMEHGDLVGAFCGRVAAIFDGCSDLVG